MQKEYDNFIRDCKEEKYKASNILTKGEYEKYHTGQVGIISLVTSNYDMSTVEEKINVTDIHNFYKNSDIKYIDSITS